MEKYVNPPNIIVVENIGRHVKSTNYYSTEMCRRGLVAASVNDRAFRLLFPPVMQNGISDSATIKEMTQGVKYVIASRGVITGGKRVIEFLFENGSNYPYILTLDYESFLDATPSQKDHGREDLTCIGYLEGKAGELQPAFDLGCKFRWGEGPPDRRVWR